MDRMSSTNQRHAQPLGVLVGTDESCDRGPRARQPRRQHRRLFQTGFENRRCVGSHGQTGRLVQLVPSRLAQRVESSRSHGRNPERRPPYRRNGDWQRCRVAKLGARRVGRSALCRRPGHHAQRLLDPDRNRYPQRGIADCDRHSAECRRRSVVRVALQTGGNPKGGRDGALVSHRSTPSGPGQSGVGAGHAGCSGEPDTTTGRDGAAPPEVGSRIAARFDERNLCWMSGLGLQKALARRRLAAVSFPGRRLALDHLERQIEGQAQGVESRTEVGRGCGGDDVHRLRLRVAAGLSRRRRCLRPWPCRPRSTASSRVARLRPSRSGGPCPLRGGG